MATQIIKLIKQSCRAIYTQARPDFSRRSAFVRRSPPTVDEVNDCIFSYKTRRRLQSREFIRELDDRDPSGQIICSAVAENVPASRYPCYTDFISVRHLLKTSATVAHHLGIYYTRIYCFDGRLVVGKYCDSSLVNIFVHNKFHRRLICWHFLCSDLVAS